MSNTSINISIEEKVARHFCKFKYCKAGPFVPAALYYHYLRHFKKGLARKLTEYQVSEEDRADKQ